MTPLSGMGVDLSFEPGPVVREPIRTDAARSMRCAPLVPERDVPFVLESIRLVRAGLPASVPLIGFAGAPFTLLCYLVCGRPSKEFAAARSFLYSSPASAERLLDRLADAMAAYLRAQAAAGAQALMLFESWAGLLAPREFERFALRAVRRTVAALHDTGVPLIYYLNQGSALMECGRGPRRRCDRRRLALAAGAGAAQAGAGQGGAGQPRPGGALCLAGRSCERMPDAYSMRPPAIPGTSSIWVTASGRKPIRTRWRGSSTTCTSAPPDSPAPGPAPHDRGASGSGLEHTAAAWFRDLQARICTAFEAFEPRAPFRRPQLAAGRRGTGCRAAASRA